MDWKRLTRLTGVAFVVLLVLSFIVGGNTPDPDASVQEVAQYYPDHTGSQTASAILGAYAVVFFVFFAGVLRATLRRTEETTATLSTLSFGGALLIAVGGSIFASLAFLFGDLGDNLDPVALQTLNAVAGEFFVPIAAGGAVFMISTGIAIRRGGALAGWMGIVAIIIGVLAVTPAGFFAFLAVMAWVLVASIMLYIREPTATSAAPSPSAADPLG
jgi:hypothetical protein